MTLTLQTVTAQNGTYQFLDMTAPTGSDYYEVISCITFDSTNSFTGYRTAIIPTNDFVDIFMLPEPGGCPVGP